MRPALLLILAGLPGIASLLLVLPEVPGVPRPVLLLNPLALLVLAALAGTFAAPRCGFRLVSRQGAAGPVAAGFALGLALAALDHLSRPLWQASPGEPASLVEGWTAGMLLVGLLYGGVVEEILLRWGLMSLVVLGLWRVLARRAASPPGTALWAGIALAALVFAAGHLPALAAGGAELTPPLVLRTLALNAAAGLAFGWIFARRGLVAAMASHAAAHPGFALAAALG